MTATGGQTPYPYPVPAVPGEPNGTVAASAVGMAATADSNGYWVARTDGSVSDHGDAANYGSMATAPLNAPISHVVATADGKGYWLVASDGGIFAYGDAGFYGSMGGRPLNAPVVGIASDSATKGYWLVASDGGIFSFGAPFHGSGGSLRLNMSVNGIAATPDDGGYWLVASDGGIFAFGDAGFYGSTPRSWAWPPTTRPGATGWWRPTAASSPTAHPSSERADRRGPGWPRPPPLRS